PRTGGPDRHGNARRRRAARARRRGRGGDSRRGGAAESCGGGGSMMTRRSAVAAAVLVTPVPWAAQAPKSQHATVTQLVGTSQVTIVYNRPSARGRTLFGRGGVVPWGRVWCPGAETATTIALSREMVVGGQRLAEGKLSIWAIHCPGVWKHIFNRAETVCQFRIAVAAQ